MSLSKQFADQRGNRCVHMRSRMDHKTCEAGVEFDSVRDTTARPYRWPCHRDQGATTTCPHARYPTAEELEAAEEAFQRTLEGIRVSRAAIVAATEGKRGVGGEMECPVCHEGTLRYSVSGYNGHIHARCSKAQCVDWME